MAYKNVMLIGGGGNLGPAILNGLLDAKTFNVSVLVRKSSKSTFPANAKVVHIGDDYPCEELVAVFKGQDAVISNVGSPAMGAQLRMVDAAVAAGVQRFLPSEFGSEPDPDHARLPMVGQKQEIRDYVVSKESAGLTWTGLCNSAFFEWGLETAFIKLDILKRTQSLAGTGDERFPLSTWRTIAAATVGVLRHPEETKNRFVYVQSFTTSMNELRAAVEKASGQTIDVVERVNTATYIPEQEEKIKQGDFGALYNWIWVQIVKGVDWSDRLDNDLLEIPKENFQQSVDKVVKEVLAKN